MKKGKEEGKKPLNQDIAPNGKAKRDESWDPKRLIADADADE